MKRTHLLTLSVVAAGCLSLAGTSFGQTGITGRPRSQNNTGTNDTGITTTQDAQTNGTGPVTAYGETNQTTAATNTESRDTTSGTSTRHTRSATKSHKRHKKGQNSDESQSGSQNDNSQSGSSDNNGHH